MSPPVFLVGTFSIPTVWLVTSLGLTPDLWTFGVIPALSVYYLCNHQKLWEVAAAPARGSRTQVVSSAIVLLLAVLCAHFGCIRLTVWKACVLLVWLFCMVMAFNFEKKMYMTDTLSALAKHLVWTVITRFTGEGMWMKYKGEWAFCDPYNRKLIDQEIQHYYTLQEKTEEQAMEQEEIIPEDYDTNFVIGSCNVRCVYTAATEDYGSAIGDDALGSVGESSPVEMQTSAIPREKARADTEPSSSRISSQEGESSSSKADLANHVVQGTFTLVTTHVNKVEVSLEHQNRTLESYTFLDRPLENVTELKQVLKVLRDEGNIIFSTLNRDIGSRTPRAHAKCHEFEELFELILDHGYKLRAVDLGEKYQCTISGHWHFHLKPLLLAGVTIGINYYQLTAPPKQLSTTILLLAFYGFFHVSFVFLDYLLYEHPCVLRRFVHSIISWIAPSKMDDMYRYFQVHASWLTFCNESYCYPYTSVQQEICMLESQGTIGRLPVICTDGTKRLRLEDDDLREGRRTFDLINLQLELVVAREDGDARVLVDAELRRTFDNMSCCYHEVFHAEESRVANLIALMRWLEKKSCVGVCRDWPDRRLMYAYRYEDLFRAVLQSGCRPMITTFVSPIEIKVE